MSYTVEQQTAMIHIVSRALLAAASGDGETTIDYPVAGLESKSGCFVTLKKNGQLRGCLGCFVTEDPLYISLAAYAKASLLEDPRFDGRRLLTQELSEVDIDISVLTPLSRCDDPENIRLGVDGIYIISSHGSGCFLPQVATETGWSVEEFWGNCCAQKAGLDFDAWKSEKVELFVFQADIIEGRYSEE